MIRTSLSFALPLLLAITLSACGGSGSQSLTPSGGAAPPGALAAARATAAPTPAPAPLFSGYVTELAAYGFNACPPSGTAYIAGYGCIPVTTTSAKIVGTQAAGMYFRVWGTVSGPNVTATEVDFSTSPPTPSPLPSPSSVPTAPPVLAGYVTELAAYGFNACPPSGSTYIAGYGCIPVTTTSAKIVGTPAAGMYFQVWGTISGPNVTATEVDFSKSPPTPAPSAGPTATPTPRPTVTPTVAPTVAPVLPSTLVNGQPLPAGFAPYAPTSVWNKPLPPITSNSYTADSAKIIAEQFGGNPGNMGEPLRDNEPGMYDGGRAIYYAKTSDPLVTIPCSTFYTGCFSGPGALPASINIPALARGSQEPGNDNRLDVIGPDGTERDFYNGGSTVFNPPGGGNWTNGSVLPGGGTGNSCGNYLTGTGLTTPDVTYGVTAGDQCAEAGLVTINDLLTGTINHALIVVTNCTNPGGVYPARNQNTNNCTDGVGPMLGYWLWYDVPCSTTRASGLKLYAQAILCALNVHGGAVMDDYGGGTIAGGMGLATEGSEPFYAFCASGQVCDYWSKLAAQGWVGLTIPGTPAGYQRWFAGDMDANGNWTPPGVNFAAHLHYLKSCVIQGTC